MRKSVIEPERNEKFTESGLEFAIEHGIIDLGDVLDKIEHMKKQEILNKHLEKYIIWEGKDKRFRTYLPDETQKNGRKLVAKSSREKLEQEIIGFYRSIEKKSVEKKETLRSLYDSWIEYKSLKVSKRSVSRIENDFQRFYINDPIIDIPLTDLDKLMCEKWALNQIQDKQLTKTAYNNMAIIFRQVLDYAKDKNLVAINVFRVFMIESRVFQSDNTGGTEITDNSSQIFFESEKEE